MSRRARNRSAAHPRVPGRVILNTMQMASNAARKLSDADVQRQGATVRRAVAEFCCARDCATHWLSLADTCDMAETLSGMRLGAGNEVDDAINNAQQVLHDTHQRHADTGFWRLHADEIDALHWLAPVHIAQLQACSYGQFEAAYRRTAQRMQQALAGNAAAGAIVIVGQVAGAYATPQAAQEDV